MTGLSIVAREVCGKNPSHEIPLSFSKLCFYGTAWTKQLSLRLKLLKLDRGHAPNDIGSGRLKLGMGCIIRISLSEQYFFSQNRSFAGVRIVLRDWKPLTKYGII